ncbi:MAG: hypothetical protein WBP65_01670 [Candidatus Sulfotelmatobacter sp.]|jgi:hypothetical protein
MAIEILPAMLRVKREGSSLGQWTSSMESRAARYLVIVATANKLARIRWAVLSSGEDLSPDASRCGCQLDEVA